MKTIRALFLLLGIIIVTTLSLPGQQIPALISPNGGETFDPGDTITFQWAGGDSLKPVHIDISSDAGMTWLTVVRNSTGSLYKWPSVDMHSSQCLARIRYVVSDSSVVQLKHPAPVGSARFSPDGRYIVTASFDKTTRLWDATTGSLLFTWPIPENRSWYNVPATGIVVHPSAVFSPDSRLVASSHGRYTAIYSVESGSLVRIIDSASQPISFSNNGKLIAGATLYNDQALGMGVWNVATGARVQSFGGGYHIWPSSLKFTYGDTAITSSNYSSTVIYLSDWQHGKGRELFWDNNYPSNGWINGVGYSQHDNRVVIAGDRFIELVNIGTTLSPPPYSYPDVYSPRDANFDPSDETIVTAGGKGLVQIWDSYTGKALASQLVGEQQVMAASFSPDGKRILSAGYDSVAAIWRIRPESNEFDYSNGYWTVRPPRIHIEAPNTNFNKVVALPKIVPDWYYWTYVWVYNDSKVPVTVRSIRFEGGDSTDFRFSTGFSYTIPRAVYALKGQVAFRPSSLGMKTSTLVVETDFDTLRQVYTGEGVMLPVQPDVRNIDFGTVPGGQIRDSSVTLTNADTNTWIVHRSWTPGTDTTQYHFTTSGDQFQLEPGQQRTVGIRFAPDRYFGTISGGVSFTYGGIGSPFILQLAGVCQGGTLSAPDEGEENESPVLKLITENPASTIATIAYRVPVSEHVQLRLIDLLGRAMETVVDQDKVPGSYRATLDLSTLPSALYFITLDVAGRHSTVPLLVQH